MLKIIESIDPTGTITAPRIKHLAQAYYDGFHLIEPRYPEDIEYWKYHWLGVKANLKQQQGGE